MRRVKYIYVLTIDILIYGCEAEIPARNVPYKLDIDIYPSYSGESLSPVIIFIHGGAWTGGDKDHWGPKQIEGSDLPVLVLIIRLLTDIRLIYRVSLKH